MFTWPAWPPRGSHSSGLAARSAGRARESAGRCVPGCDPIRLFHLCASIHGAQLAHTQAPERQARWQDSLERLAGKTRWQDAHRHRRKESSGRPIAAQEAQGSGAAPGCRAGREGALRGRVEVPAALAHRRRTLAARAHSHNTQTAGRPSAHEPMVAERRVAQTHYLIALSPVVPLLLCFSLLLLLLLLSIFPFALCRSPRPSGCPRRVPRLQDRARSPGRRLRLGAPAAGSPASPDSQGGPSWPRTRDWPRRTLSCPTESDFVPKLGPLEAWAVLQPRELNSGRYAAANSPRGLVSKLETVRATETMSRKLRGETWARGRLLPWTSSG